MGKLSKADTDQMRQELAELAANARPGALKKALKMISKPQRVSVPHICSPRPMIAVAWKPKHLEATKKAITMIRDGVGLHTAPYPVTAIEGAWPNKFFCSDIAQRLLHDATACPTGDKAATSTCALIVASLAARIVEEAKLIAAEDPSLGELLVMQKAGEDPGWDRVKTRGSGIVFSDSGRQIYDRAVARVAAKLEQMQSA